MKTQKISIEKLDPASGRMEIEFTADLPIGKNIDDVKDRLLSGYKVRPFQDGDETQFFGISETDTPHKSADELEVMLTFG